MSDMLAEQENAVRAQANKQVFTAFESSPKLF